MTDSQTPKIQVYIPPVNRPVTKRHVLFMDGTEAYEYETEYVGASETQYSFEYTDLDNNLLDVTPYQQNYWGQVEGRAILGT